MRRIFLLLVGLASCSGESAPSKDSLGAQLYKRYGCVLCHGPAGAGTAQGPPLRGLEANWTRERLAEYFSDPRAVAQKDPRLDGLRRRFPMEMPGVELPQSDRLALAEAVLALSAQAISTR